MKHKNTKPRAFNWPEGKLSGRWQSQRALLQVYARDVLQRDK